MYLGLAVALATWYNSGKSICHSHWYTDAAVPEAPSKIIPCEIPEVWHLIESPPSHPYKEADQS